MDDIVTSTSHPLQARQLECKFHSCTLHLSRGMALPIYFCFPHPCYVLLAESEFLGY